MSNEEKRAEKALKKAESQLGVVVVQGIKERILVSVIDSKTGETISVHPQK